MEEFHFTDTTEGWKVLSRRVCIFEWEFPVGKGARKGPSMMPGGDMQASVSSAYIRGGSGQSEWQPCVTISAGRIRPFLKMVHNGIEYGIMQLIAETYAIMKNGLNLSDEEIHQAFERWSSGKLQSFLMDITSDILGFKDKDSGELLLNQIKDEARSKGTGKWTSQVAMDCKLL